MLVAGIASGAGGVRRLGLLDEELLDEDTVPDHSGPGTVVIGEVVRLRDALVSVTSRAASVAR